MDVAAQSSSMVANLISASSFFSGAQAQQFIMLGLGFAGLLVLWLSSRRHKTNRAGGRRSAARGAKDVEVGATLRDLESAMGSLDALSSQIQVRLDAKITKLEALIRVADDRMDRLARSTRSVDGQPTVDVVADDADLGAIEGETTPNANGSLNGPGASAHEAIYRLADAGMPVLQIARQVNRPRGEIELILSLRKTAQSNVI